VVSKYSRKFISQGIDNYVNRTIIKIPERKKLLKRSMNMIRAMIERKAKASEDLSALLVELRVAAITRFPGYIGGETLVNTEDNNNIVVISTWRSIEDWERWATSETRAKLYERIEPLLQEKPKVRTFRIMGTEQTIQH